MERTFVMIKPDGVQRRLIGQIVARFEMKGLTIRAMKLARMPLSSAENLYSVHKGKPFYHDLVRYITSSSVVMMVLEGYRAVTTARKLLGATFGYDAEPGTIRGDFGNSKGLNLIHGSDSPESAAREIPIFFTEAEIPEYASCDREWVNEPPERNG